MNVILPETKTESMTKLLATSSQHRYMCLYLWHLPKISHWILRLTQVRFLNIQDQKCVPGLM